MKKFLLFIFLLGISTAAYSQGAVVSAEASRSKEQTKAVGSNLNQSQTTVKSTGKNLGVVELTDATFRTLVYANAGEGRYLFLGDRPTIVDFTASWCGPCQRFAPTFEAMAKKYGDRMNFYKVDVDKCKVTSSDLEITSIPTLLFIPLDDEPCIRVGAPDAGEFEEIILEQMLN
ncbi:MAG: thioredoxin domain-containing protein [Rikenellaceae bacterium]